ncbi:Carboxypeptidase-related protein [Euzebya pacifica]|uniref:Carboxypeptidase-related protein n=1 Tax=Euzebya pacifica TaxID=1608957 RepID=A0A346XRU0_9ACTN|nr:hypothetical protein [Euzebya pacifica]AXV04937.1 Carboxypeptidase-related protein [Euzebya pacifica]
MPTDDRSPDKPTDAPTHAAPAADTAADTPSADTVTPEHRPPAGASAAMTWAPDGHESLDVTATAGWTVLRREESPAAEMFAVAYTLDGADPGERPVTFVFNGGPGASSAFLHVGPSDLAGSSSPTTARCPPCPSA